MLKNSTILTLIDEATVPTSDSELIQAMADGEVEALHQLYTRYGTTLLVYLISTIGDRPLAEEVLQDVMLAAWKGAARFRAQSSVKTWLLAIARHQALNARTRRPPPFEPLEPDKQLAVAHTQPEQLLEQGLADQELRQAILSLPAEQRETLELLFYQNLSTTEVARVMRVSPGTVRSRLSRARSTLRKLINIGEELI